MRWVLLLILSANLFASPIEDLAPSSSNEIASLKTDLLVGGFVNPFSGQLSLRAEDLHVRAAQDLVLSRVFVPPQVMGRYDDRKHRDKFELAGDLAASKGWAVLPHLWCGVNAKSPYFQVPDPNGFVLEFKKVGNKWILATPNYGMSNLDGEEPSSKADLRNTELEVDQRGARVTTPNGTRRVYEKLGVGVFRLEREILPNGKVIRYDFLNNQIARVVSCDGSGKHVYAFVKMLGSGRFAGSDGSEAAFSYEQREIRGSKKNKKVEFSRSLLTKSFNPFYSNTMGYNERHLLSYYDSKECTIHCKYTSEKGVIAQVERLAFPIGSYEFFYERAIAGEKGGSTTVIHPSGTKTIYRFDQRLLLTAIENWNGRLVNQKLFYYDGKQRIAKVETKDGDGNLLIAKVFECDEAGNPLVETWLGDFGTFSIQRNFSKNRIVREERDDGLGFEFGYLNDTHLVTSKTTLDHGTAIRKTMYVYDDACNLIRESVEGRTVVEYRLRTESPHLHRIEWREERDWDGELLGKTRYEYDQWGHVAREEIYGSNGMFAYAIERTYNQKGELLASTNPLGQTASYEYDSRGRLIREVPFSRKLAIGRQYDEKGRLVAVKEGEHIAKFEYDDSDLLIQKTDYLGFTTRYSQDPVHKRPIEIDAPPRLTRIVYDSFGREVEKSDGYGNATATRYNSFGSPVEILHPSGGKDRFEYGANGSLLSQTDPDGIVTSYTRDVLGRVTSRTAGSAKSFYRYDGYELLQEVDTEGTITDFVYDYAGRKTKEITAGRETAFNYDALGFLAKVQKGNRATEYVRDPLGRVLEESIAGLLKTSWSYDESGNVASVTRGGVASFVYDAYDRLVEKIDPLGFRTTISYEEGDKSLVKRRTDPRGIETVETYDSHGLLQKKEIPGVQLQEFEYDRNLRKIRYDRLNFTYAPEGWLTSVTEAGKRTTWYTHTLAGRIKNKELPDGQILHYEYDSAGFVSKIGDLGFNYDTLGRLIGGSGFKRTLDSFGNVIREEFGNGLWIESKYDEWDRPVVRTLPDGSAIQYVYDPVFLRSVNRLDGSGNVLYGHSYDSYDEAGNLLAETHRSPVRYAYDKVGRQVYRSDDYLTESCRYDGVGNLLEKGARSYLYDPLSQLNAELPDGFNAVYDSRYNCIELNEKPIPVNELNQVESENYDLNGNLVWSGYVYDAHGRLIEANGQCYIYDATGRRLSKSNTSFLYIGDEEIGSFENGQFLELRIPGLRRAVSIEVGSIPYIPVHDAQDTIRMLVDWKTGVIKEQNNSDAFGRGVNRNVPYAYAGKRFDEETGLFYFGKRYYNPALMRWTSPDPLGSINSANLYQYVYNNPFRYIDPRGENIWGFCLGMGEIIVGGTLMLTGGIIEVASLGTLTIAVGFQEAAGLALITDGFARSMVHSRDISFPTKTYKSSTQNQGSIQSNESNNKGSRNRLEPDEKAVGDHTAFKRNPETGKVYKYETYQTQTNPNNPQPWDPTKRFDGLNSNQPPKSHFNKATQENVPEPHVHDPHCPGGIRPAFPWEIPQ